MNKWDRLASEESLQKTVEALKENGITAHIVENGERARKKALELIPEGAEVFAMTSVTSDTIGLSKELNESGHYNSVRETFNKLMQDGKRDEMRKLGAVPDFTVGSINAVSEDGKVVIASNTGSQLPAYAYGAGKVVWVVGTQKIVGNLDDAFKRVYEHVLPLESDRVHKAYGVAGSNVSKMLVISKEINPNRINLIFVKEVLGF